MKHPLTSRALTSRPLISRPLISRLLNRTVALVALIATAFAFSSAHGQSLSQAVAADLLKAYEHIENDRHRDALNELNRLIQRRSDSMTDFDRASVLQIRGIAHANLDDLESAVQDFREVLRIDALPEEQNRRIRGNMAQLYFATERYAEAIQFFNDWLREEPEAANDNTYFMIAGSYYQLNQHANAVDPINRAIELAAQPERRYYDLKNSLLNELGRDDERVAHLRRMISLWPEEANLWRQLSAQYGNMGDDLRAFTVLEAAYHGGLIEQENDLILLVQYYSAQNNPYRGAKLLEKEMADGRIPRNVSNLQLLSQLWSQAREHKESIPVLREAAQLSDTGLLSFRLGQALLADEQNEAAEQALQAALNKGGIDANMQGEAWLLMGTSRFNRAGPGAVALRQSADQAFARAQAFGNTRAQASSWRQYIQAIDDTERRQASLEAEQAERLEVAAAERALTACRAQQLAGADLTEECTEMLEAAAADPDQFSGADDDVEGSEETEADETPEEEDQAEGADEDE